MNEKNKQKDLTPPEADVIKNTDTQSAPSEKIERQAVPGHTTTIQRVMTDNDSLISDLVAEAPKSVADIAIGNTPGNNLLELPEECEPLHGKKFRYRWLANDKYLAGRLRHGIWILCTRENSPYINSTRFKTHGAVEQAGMLLGFTAEGLAVAKEKQAAQASADLVKHYTEELPDPTNKGKGFYKPESAGSGEEDDDEGQAAP